MKLTRVKPVENMIKPELGHPKLPPLLRPKSWRQAVDEMDVSKVAEPNDRVTPGVNVKHHWGRLRSGVHAAAILKRGGVGVSLRERVKEKMKSWFVYGPWTRVSRMQLNDTVVVVLGLAVLLAALLICGFLLSLKEGVWKGDHSYTFGEGVWSSVSMFLDPGNGGDEVIAARRVVSILLGILGMAFLAVFIAVVVDALSAVMARRKAGRGRVYAEDHYVIIGYVKRAA